jgi:outer membrane immunogenic protein
MRRKFLPGFGLLAFAAAGAGSAVAADIAARPGPPPPAAAPAFISDWAGFYIGINGGGGWGHETFNLSEFDSRTQFTVPPNASPKGGVFGFQAGHNWQWGPVVGGLEVDFDGADLTSSTTFIPIPPPIATATLDKKIDELASVRARLGYLIFPNWLLYGTTGIGWGHDRFTTAAASLSGPFLAATQTSDLNMFGWVVGVGLEYKFANNWLIRGEWLHYDFGRVTDPNNSGVLNGPNFFAIDNGNVRTTVDVARAALSWKFP